MIATEPFLVLYQKWEEAVLWAEQQLTQAGFEALRTFDLQDARAGQSACPCPHHGTGSCNCQMVVLLVYGKDSQPLSLMLHGHDDTTWFYATNTPQQHADARLLSTIHQELIPIDMPLTNDEPSIPSSSPEKKAF
jgi:hypothetical protein